MLFNSAFEISELAKRGQTFLNYYGLPQRGRRSHRGQTFLTMGYHSLVAVVAEKFAYGSQFCSLLALPLAAADARQWIEAAGAIDRKPELLP